MKLSFLVYTITSFCSKIELIWSNFDLKAKKVSYDGFYPATILDTADNDVVIKKFY